MKRALVPVFVCCLLLAGCSQQEKSAQHSLDTLAWSRELLQFRQQQDSFLSLHPESPLRKRLPADRKVSRYKPDVSYCVLATIDRLPRREPWLLATSSGESRRMLRLGYLDFSLHKRNCRLAVFAYEEDPKALFVPFLDSTSGRETYPAGRYLDLRDDGSGKVWVDFNRAYHPYCAYNADYSCPLVPSENRLPLSVRAGESLQRDTLSWE